MSAAPSPEAELAARDIAFEAIVEACALVESYSLSAAEAAWRGDRLTLRMHLEQLGLATIAALQTFTELDDGHAA